MSFLSPIVRIVLGVATLVSPLALAGELEVGPYTIRYNALSASALPASSAAQYGIEHVARQGLVNITVSRRHAAGTESVRSSVHGRALTLTGAPIPITFRSIEGGGATSWLGTFQIPGTETLRFEIDVTPAGEATTRIEFIQDFVIE